jgi:hypothetical protein
MKMSEPSQQNVVWLPNDTENESKKCDSLRKILIEN